MIYYRTTYTQYFFLERLILFETNTKKKPNKQYLQRAVHVIIYLQSILCIMIFDQIFQISVKAE